TIEAFRTWLAQTGAWEGLLPHVPTLLELESVQAFAISRRRIGLFVGARVLVFVDASGRMSVPMPVEVGENLCRLGSLAPHPDHANNGWYRFVLGSNGDEGTAAWLIGLTHLLYALSQRGASDPITQREMDTYSQGPRCVAALTAAAARWDASPICA
ncbi:MAG: hypothetical protein VX265_16685, partial [Myxococcota bacterium]|nr:hypothetical protein [Myxococcota bacterium]